MSDASANTLAHFGEGESNAIGDAAALGRSQRLSFYTGKLAEAARATDFGACLIPLLTALKWRGDPRHVAEALPHFVDTLDLTGFRNVMANLNFTSRPGELKLREIDSRLLPCLYVPKNHAAMVVLKVDAKNVTAFDGSTGKIETLPIKNLDGTAFFFKPVDDADYSASQARVGWFRSATERFRAIFYQTLGVTLILNIIALSSPLFTMQVYDKVIASKSVPTLVGLMIGMLMAIGFDIVLRWIRSKFLAHVGARLDMIVGNAVFQRILFLPPAFTERATIGAQVARIKDFESIREFFTGPLALVFFELPFSIFFIIVIALLAGPLAFVPMVMVGLFILLAMIVNPFVRNSVARSSRAGSQRQEFVVEALSKMRALKYTGSDRTWLDRYRELSAKSAMANFQTAQVSAIVQTVSQMMVITAGAITIAFGVFRVLSGDMTIGALVATMILVWRVLSPLQTGFVAMTRLESVISSVKQIDNLMNIRPERNPREQVAPLKKLKGHVTFARVSLRYTNDADPALVGVSFEAEPGEVVAVIGRNGSGKSTLVKLVAGLYTPQAGSIRIDGIDIRQMDPIELRHAIGYVPQSCDLFFGSVEQNLRLVHATATDEELVEATKMALCYDDIMALPRGFQTRIGDSASAQLPSSFTQRLSLARAYLKPAQIMLFDEPVNTLDGDGDRAFIQAIENLRGKATIFIVTHRPSHLKMADKILVLDTGYLRLAGPADEVRPQIPKDLL